MFNFISVKDYRGEIHVVNPNHIVEIDPNLPNEPNCSAMELSNGRRIIVEDEIVNKVVEYLKGGN